MGACNVCRNGGQVTNPGHSFQMADPVNNRNIDWTCGWLEESVADVNPQGASGEAFLCGLAQLWAEKECTCNGPPIPPLSDNVIDPNPACNLCQGQALNYVPSFRADDLVETGVAGRMPCSGLYSALSNGVLPASLCPTVRQNAGDFCCSEPVLDPAAILSLTSNAATTNSATVTSTPPATGSTSTNNDPVAYAPSHGSCHSLHERCEDHLDCCGDNRCKMRVIGDPSICSPGSTFGRQSISSGAGGAAGASKLGN